LFLFSALDANQKKAYLKDFGGVEVPVTRSLLVEKLEQFYPSINSINTNSLVNSVENN
jgi:hypothetical protein